MGVSILLADDHRLFALGIKRILDFIPEYALVGTVENGYEVILFLEKNQNVDVLVLDLNMPVMNGMQVLSYLNRKYPKLKKLILSGEHTKSNMEACKNLGANGFIGKDSCFKSFHEALDTVAGGGEYFQSVSSHQNIFNGHWNCLYQKLREAYRLSDRETEIIQMVLNQCETKDIAYKLHLSPLTVKTHRKNIYRKLRVHNVSGLLSLIKEHPGL
ncbi:MAG: DNA-binding response regulator [Mongoliibacter sp.]|uniref:response regulator n=1 Tax=Mongoliibacter sp. TaxID=2022438 RepID=UPI0012F00E1F|nr:response regulator transcription factor [Mongoliibacter sp.]TVP49638.1 MAG: DNA-binding response regulator [Mongoliibacter sp.]